MEENGNDVKIEGVLASSLIAKFLDNQYPLLAEFRENAQGLLNILNP